MHKWTAMLLCGWAAAWASGCGQHSSQECTDQIPCPMGMVCAPTGVCEPEPPPDALPDARVRPDASPIDAVPPPDGPPPDAPGPCSHDPCSEGPALDPSCTQCTGVVCNVDTFCCEVIWDNVCVDIARMRCPNVCP